jgi:prepilin-type N-terminal cleavage/methylation domain-containing protein
LSRHTSASGFSLIELLVATALLLIVSSIVTTALMQMTHAQKTIWNRTEMHSGIRGATELLQQEVGQAGRVTLPGAGTIGLKTAVNAAGISSPCTATAVAPWWAGGTTLTVDVTSVTGLWADAQRGIKLAVLDGNNSETITVQAIAGNTITACFSRSHLTASAATPVTMMALGGFAEGIVGPSPAYSITVGGVTTTGTYVNGSDKNHLKLFGDVNGNGDLVYVEYVCDNGTIPGIANPSHNLYRNVMAFNVAPPKANVTNSQILLSNVWPNPNDTGGDERPCFKYQWTTISNLQYVTDVAITLTVQTEQIDTITRQKQTETKALLNVSPRNVFDVWTMVGYGEVNRVQFTPPSVTALLPNGIP